SPTRLLGVLIAVGFGFLLRRMEANKMIVAGCGFVLLTRVLFEPVGFIYYLCPGLALVLVLVFSTERIPWATLAAATALVASLWWNPPRIVWWSVFYLLWCVLAWAAVREIW